MSAFAQQLITWQREHGRHHLPWQCDDPYRIWLSEIMLQQTQVATVIPYYERFLKRFPDIHSLANASQESVLEHWSGLGYYARARNLHYAAQQIYQEHHGNFPQTRSALETLKGVGRSTAAAIAVFAWGKREAICDGNVKRVLARHFALNIDSTTTSAQPIFWQLAESLLPHSSEDLKSYTQALMDLGSLICKRTRPLCQQCPVQNTCQALARNAVSAYPKKATKAPKPSRDGYFLLCRQPNGDILFSQRAEKALWGNLWILPWFDTEQALQAFAHQHHMQAQSKMQSAFCHVFTHYRLNIHYQEYYLSTPQLNGTSSTYRWLSSTAIQSAALPAAMKKLLNLKRS